MTIETFPVELAWRRHATPHVLQLAFRRSDGAAVDYQPGQFLNLHFNMPDGAAHRSYSIASPPAGDGLLEIAMSPVAGGLASGALAALDAGEQIPASGPYGRFVLRDDPPCRYVLVGTGTGITPYRAMLPQLADRLKAGFRVHIVLGVWRREELLFGADFMAFAAAHAGCEFSACYSREFPEDPQSWEHAGYVQSLYGQLGLDPMADIIYLCGNPAMIDESVDILQGLGFTLKQLRREKYLPARPVRRAASQGEA